MKKIFLSSFIIFSLFSVSILKAKGMEFNFAIGSKYKAETTRSFAGYATSGDADLSGTDIRFVYLTPWLDEKLGIGLKIANHSGSDNKGLAPGYSYSIKVSEFTPFAKYSIPFKEDNDILIEGYFLGGFGGGATIEASHTILAANSASTTGLMLEGGVFVGMKSDDATIGIGLNLPLDGYTASYSWTFYGYILDYNITVKRQITPFIIIKMKI